VVWDKEGKEGTEIGELYRGMGWKGRKEREEGGEGNKEEEDYMAPNQSSWIRHCIYNTIHHHIHIDCWSQYGVQYVT
jgi:hypothetical protein